MQERAFKMGDHQWLLVDTLTKRPVVVAQGDRPRDFLPLDRLLRRNPYLREIMRAIADAAGSADRSTLTTQDGARIIVAEPIVMTDGRVHGVQVWTGPVNSRRPHRPAVGAVMWDLTDGVAADTAQALWNSGKDPAVERTQGRSLAEDLAVNDAAYEEAKILSLALNARSGQTYCSTLDVRSHRGEIVKVSFAARTDQERWSDGRNHLVARAMNWRSEGPPDGGLRTNLANRILQGTAQVGIHRALVDPVNWRLLKWIDAPSPYFDWRGDEQGRPLVHPLDESKKQSMTGNLLAGPASDILRLRAQGGKWTQLHVTMYTIELDEGVRAGLISTRLPTPGELGRENRLSLQVIRDSCPLCNSQEIRAAQ